MKIDRSGMILYVLKYQECVGFYRDILDLPIMFASEHLTCFEVGGSYLMVELDDEYYKHGTSEGRTRTCLRMNVPDVKVLAEKLNAKEIEVNYQEHEWGTIAKFYDPDGNLCAFKDSDTFEKQIDNEKSHLTK